MIEHADAIANLVMFVLGIAGTTAVYRKKFLAFIEALRVVIVAIEKVAEKGGTAQEVKEVVASEPETKGTIVIEEIVAAVDPSDKDRAKIRKGLKILKAVAKVIK
jgi:hypothetical protein